MAATGVFSPAARATAAPRPALEQLRVERSRRGDEPRPAADRHDRARGGRLRPRRRPRQEQRGRLGERRCGGGASRDRGDGAASADVDRRGRWRLGAGGRLGLLAILGHRHQCSSNTWPVKTDSFAPSRQASFGSPAFSDNASSICSTFQPCSGATCGRKSASVVVLLEHDAVRADHDLAIRGDRRVAARGRSPPPRASAARRPAPARSADRARPRRAPPARCRSRAGTSAGADRCSRGACRAAGSRAGSLRLSVTKTPWRRSCSRPVGKARQLAPAGRPCRAAPCRARRAPGARAAPRPRPRAPASRPARPRAAAAP